MKNFFLCLLCCVCFSCSVCSSETYVSKYSSGTPTIIFETDIGNDVDDALALDMIYKYLDEKKINVLAICSNKNSEYSTEYIHLMNHWYGYDRIPIGKVINGIDSENDAKNYAKHVCLLKDNNNQKLFKRPDFNYDSIPDAVKLYRKILANQKNRSVTIVSVGFSTNIVRLLNSPPDEHSELTGKELIRQKVKLLSIMAGSFGVNKIAEYNVMKDIPSAQSIVLQWPTKIVFTPYEAGVMVNYPGNSIKNDFDWIDQHPLVEAYKSYMAMPYDRPTWDLIALLYVVENSKEYFTQQPMGKVSIDQYGYTSYYEDKKGEHTFLTVNEIQADSVKKRFIEIITRIPKFQRRINN